MYRKKEKMSCMFNPNNKMKLEGVSYEGFTPGSDGIWMLNIQFSSGKAHSGLFGIQAHYYTLENNRNRKMSQF